MHVSGLGRKRGIIAIALLITSLSSGRAWALSYVGDIAIDHIFGPTGHSAEGIAFDESTGNLILATSIGHTDHSTLYEITTGGSLLNTYHVPIDRVKGVTFLNNGNLLLSNSAPAADGGGLFEYTTTGSAVGGGLNLTIDPPSNDNDGVFFNPVSNSLFVADDKDEMIYEFSLAGALLNSIDTKAIDSAFNDPEGVAVNPLTGNIYVADASKGTNTLYELNAAGGLVTSFDFLGTGYLDPEGITLDPVTGLLYVAGDNAQRIAIFDIGSSHDGGGGSHAAMPEPATATLGILALAGIGAAMRRRRLA